MNHITLPGKSRAYYRFEVGDLRQAVKASRTYDVAILAAVGAIGDYRRTVLEVRRIVRPGGVLVIDDGFLEGDAGRTPPGYGYYRSRGETVRELTSHGDRMMHERLVAANNREVIDDAGVARGRAQPLGQIAMVVDAANSDRRHAVELGDDARAVLGDPEAVYGRTARCQGGDK